MVSHGNTFDLSPNKPSPIYCSDKRESLDEKSSVKVDFVGEILHHSAVIKLGCEFLGNDHQLNGEEARAMLALMLTRAEQQDILLRRMFRIS